MRVITGMRFLLLSALLVFCAACAESSGSVKREGTIKVVTTTGMIGELGQEHCRGCRGSHFPYGDGG